VLGYLKQIILAIMAVYKFWHDFYDIFNYI